MQTIFKAGNSLAISIPSKLVKKLGLQAGQHVTVDVQPDTAQMVVEFPDRSQLSLINPAK